MAQATLSPREGLPPMEARIATSRRAMAQLPNLPKRLSFALTREQFAELVALSEAERNLRLGILAHAHEYEQRRRQHHFGGPGLMPTYLETALAKEWPSIREDRLAEAQRAFAAMAIGEAA